MGKFWPLSRNFNSGCWACIGFGIMLTTPTLGSGPPKNFSDNLVPNKTWNYREDSVKITTEERCLDPGFRAGIYSRSLVSRSVTRTSVCSNFLVDILGFDFWVHKSSGIFTSVSLDRTPNVSLAFLH